MKSSSETAATSPETQVIHDLLERYYDTMSERDRSAYRDFLVKSDPHHSLAKPGEAAVAVHITSIDEFIAQIPQGPDSQPIFEERMQQAEIEVREHLAQVWVKYKAKIGSEEQLHEWEGTDFVYPYAT